MTHAEETCAALKQMKDVTTLMSEERNPTVSLICAIHAQLLKNAEPDPSDSPLVRDIKKAFHEDLSKRYDSEEEKRLLYSAAAVDPRFKELPFLSQKEREETYTRVIAEAASLEVANFS